MIGSDVAVKEQYPTAGEDVITNQKIFLKTDGKMTMPVFSFSSLPFFTLWLEA
jgi:penicillin-binding protein 2B